jgi:prolyl 4-hydroxylase
MDPQIEKKLRCRYITNGVAFLKLQPIKEEEAYLNPRILIYHDVITDKEIDIVKKMAQPRVRISLTIVQFP